MPPKKVKIISRLPSSPMLLQLSQGCLPQAVLHQGELASWREFISGKSCSRGKTCSRGVASVTLVYKASYTVPFVWPATLVEGTPSALRSGFLQGLDSKTLALLLEAPHGTDQRSILGTDNLCIYTTKWCINIYQTTKWCCTTQKKLKCLPRTLVPYMHSTIFKIPY